MLCFLGDALLEKVRNCLTGLKEWASKNRGEILVARYRTKWQDLFRPIPCLGGLSGLFGYGLPFPGIAVLGVPDVALYEGW